MANPDFAFSDGFDHYTAAGDGTLKRDDLLLREWTSNTDVNGYLGAYFVAPLSGPSTGCALRLFTTSPFTNYAQKFAKTLPGNYARCVGGAVFKAVNNRGSQGVTFGDAATDQLSIGINPTTGTVSVRRGSLFSTVIATSVESLPAGGGYIEWDITFHGTTGIIKVWINQTLTTLNLTGQNTKVSGNNYINTFGLSLMDDSTNSEMIVDHLYAYFYLASGGSELPLLYSHIVETQFATGDSAVQSTAGPSVLGADFRTTNATNAPGSNILALRRFVPDASATLNSVSIVPSVSSGAAKFKAVLYADSAGAPGAVVATGTEVVGAVNGTTLVLPFAAGQALTGGTGYWIGIITDTSVGLQQYDSSTNTGRVIANTYTSGAPATAGAMTVGQPSWLIWGNCTGAATRYSQANKAEATLNEYNSDATVTDTDLLTFPALAITPASIAMVSVRAAAVKTDGGARAISLVAKSGATTGTGSAPGLVPSVGIQYLTSNYFTDPNTAAAWAAAAVNASTAGVNIAS